MAEIVSDVLPVFAVVLDGVRVSRVDPEPDTVAGLKDAVTPLGRPLTAKDTEPVKPLAGVTVKVSVALMPPKQKARMQIGGVTETLAALLESANDGAAVTMKDCDTGVAALIVVPLPACEATMVQVPGAFSAAEVPDTVHTDGVFEAKATVSPELAVAFSARLVPAFWLAIAPKVMLWLDSTALTMKDCDTGVAAATVVPLPG